MSLSTLLIKSTVPFATLVPQLYKIEIASDCSDTTWAAGNVLPDRRTAIYVLAISQQEAEDYVTSKRTLDALLINYPTQTYEFRGIASVIQCTEPIAFTRGAIFHIDRLTQEGA